MGILSELNEKRKEAQKKLKDEFLGFTSSVSRKFIPKELRPALPFLSAAVPFMVPATGIFAGPLGRALLSSGSNLLAQGLSDPEAEDLNLLSAAIAGATGALSSPEVAGSMRKGIEVPTTTAREAGIMALPGGAPPTGPVGELGFLQGAENIGREGIATLSDVVTGTGETFRKFGRDPGALFEAGKKGARFPGLKELGKAVALPAAQGTGDLAFTEATKALREFNATEAAELAQAGADEAAIAEARRNAIRFAMEVSGFEEDDIIETFDELGLKEGGIVSLAEGGMLDFGGKEMDLRKGGFVPIGKKEKADDVPARLSKNEFVMTADAVRAAGGGSVNKGAQRMYDLMNNLEARA
jgi:hypothetical protein